MDRRSFFYNRLGEVLLKEGFKFLKTKKSFVKSEDGNEFIFKVNEWEAFYAIETELGIRIGQIEEIKKAAWGSLYDKFISIGRVKSYLIDIPSEGVVKTDTEDNVKRAVEGEIQFYFSFAKTYYKRNLDYNYLDKKLNSNFGEELYLAHNPIHTSFLAIIVAKLTNNPRVDDAFAFYRDIILKFNDVYIQEFDLLVAYLKEYSNG